MLNHINDIKITNFKSVRDLDITNCKRINLFIGYPNVGKSAILEAISGLSYFKVEFNEPIDKTCRIKNPNELFYNGFTTQDAVITLKNGRVIYKYGNENELYLNAEISTIINGESSWKHYRDLCFYCLNQNEFRINSQNHTNLQFNDREIEMQLPKVKKYVFKDSFNSFKTNGTTLFSPYGENIVDVIQVHKELRKEIGELFKGYGLKLLTNQGTNSIQGYKELDDETIIAIPYYQMAETLQRLIFHKAAIQSNKDSVLLFEEPEAHMYPPYISKFTSDIIYNKDNGNQYFITTHSPFVINDFLESLTDELSIYAVGLTNGETTIKRLTDEQMDEIRQYGIDLFFNLEDYL